MFALERLLRRATADENRHFRLLWSLVVLFLLYPVMQGLGWQRFWSLLLVAELLLAVHTIGESSRSLKIALILVTPAALGELSFFFFENRETHWFAVISVVSFLAYVITVVYRRSIFLRGRVTADRVSGAIAVYLLLGLLWGIVYGLVAVVDPAAFQGLESFSLHEPGAQPDYIYFSFVTLTTLGYGDISPLTPVAKTLAWMEAVFGQLFVAVTIARLVSLQVSHSERARAEAADRSDSA